MAEEGKKDSGEKKIAEVEEKKDDDKEEKILNILRKLST